MSTVRILIPGGYLDKYREQEPADGVADELHHLLSTVAITGEGSGRKATLDVPVALLPSLAGVAYDHFMAWGDEQDRRKHNMPAEERSALARRAREAFLVFRQAKYPDPRMSSEGSAS